MSHNLALIIALVVPTLLLVALRINAAMVFLSLCLGAVLLEYVGGEANSLLTLISAQADTVSATTVQLILLFTPAVVTCAVTIISLHGRLRTAINFLPAAASSLLAVLLAVPVLSPGLRHALESQVAWHQLLNAQALVVGVGAVISLAFLWTQRRSFKERDKRRR